MRARGANQNGFTLIELMIVLIIIGIFSGLMVAEMRGTMEDALLRSTARKLISAVNLANSKAVTINRPHTLFLDPAASRFRLIAQGETIALAEDSLDSRIHLEVRRTAVKADDESEEAPPEPEERPPDLNQVHFLPDGSADPRDILLRDRMGVALVLRVNPATARVNIIENEVTP